VALAFGFLSRSVTAAAARDAGRAPSFERGQGLGTAYEDAQAAAYQDVNSGLTLVAQSPASVSQAQGSPAPRQWGFAASCACAQATAPVVYDADVFPAIVPGQSGAFVVQAAATFPVE
jgi:hypothetical protein